jgi:hypothetical protein
LILNATGLERNWIRNFTDNILKNINRHKGNYLLKSLLTVSFLYNLCKAQENVNLLILRRTKFSPKSESDRKDVYNIFYNTGISFLFTAAAFTLI